jgi:hypothetical protein
LEVVNVVRDDRQLARKSRRPNQNVFDVDQTAAPPEMSEHIAGNDCVLGTNVEDRDLRQDLTLDARPESATVIAPYGAAS